MRQKVCPKHALERWASQTEEKGKREEARGGKRKNKCGVRGCRGVQMDEDGCGIWGKGVGGVFSNRIERGGDIGGIEYREKREMKGILLKSKSHEA